VAAATSIPGAGGTLTCALPAFNTGFYANFQMPGTIKVPSNSAGSVNGYVTLTYTNITQAGTNITFVGCAGGTGSQVTPGAPAFGTLNVVTDEGVWTGGNTFAYHFAVNGSSPDKTYTTSPAKVLNSIAQTFDGQEIWWTTGTDSTFGSFAGGDLQNINNINGQGALPGGANSGYTIVLTSDGYILLPIVRAGLKGQVFALVGGTVSINPSFLGYYGINFIPSGWCTLDAVGAGAI
jgi:hypothetical protein